MYKQFLKILQKSDDIYLFFLCENMSFNLGMNSTDTLYFSKIILHFSFKIHSITLDPDPKWAKILDPDPNSMYLDPQH